MKKNKPFGELFYRSLKKILLTMRIAVILMILGILQARANDAYSQKTMLSLNFSETPLVKVLDKIEDESEFFFLYNEKLLDTERKVSITEKDQLIGSILDNLFRGTDVKYTIIDRKIILAPDYLTEVSQPQQNRITGTVTGKDGTPIPGANVVVTGTTQGKMTDIAGKYSIEVPQGSKSLTFSFIGMESQEISIGILTKIDVTMVESAIGLDEVVVIGYGSQAKKSLTGAISTVSSTALNVETSANPITRLQGKVSGVSVINSHVPGGDAIINIRGLGTINNNKPLFVIDGVPTKYGTSQINPNEIESITVLKDATSAAIYGARGANGVIIITTNHGSAGKTKVSFTARYGISGFIKLYDLLNTQEYGELLWLTYKNQGKVPYDIIYGSGPTPTIPDYFVPAGRMEGDPEADPAKYNYNMGAEFNNITKANKVGTDWSDVILQKAPLKEYNLALSGGGEKATYALNIGYSTEDGILKYTSFDRYSIRSNADSKVNNWLKVGESLGLTYSVGKGNNNDNSEGSIITRTFQQQPIAPVYDIMGNFAGGGWVNPLAALYRAKDDFRKDIRGIGNGYAEIQFMKGLTFKSLFGFDYRNYNGRVITRKAPEQSHGDIVDALTMSNNYTTQWNWVNTLNYTKAFGSHTVNVLLGTEALSNTYFVMSARRSTFASDNPLYMYLDAGEKDPNNSGNGNESKTASYFGRLNYDYNGKYLLEVTFRRDGSSMFGANNRWGNFPAASVGWRISEEGFMAGIKHLVNNLKIRGGYGVSGNDELGGYYNGYSTYNVNIGSSFYSLDGDPTAAQAGFYAATIGNPDAKWETTSTMNIGLDVAALNNKFTATLDVWQRKTKDMLFRIAIPTVAGAAGAPSVNIGDMNNKGFDLSLNYANTALNDDLTYGLGLSLSHYKNKVAKISSNKAEFLNGTSYREVVYTRASEGTAFPEFYGLIVDGIFQTQAEADAYPKEFATYNRPGHFKFRDVNSDGVIDDNDRTYIGSPHPKFTAGLNMDIGYKAFNLNAFWYSSYGNKVISFVNRWIEYGMFGVNSTKERLYKSWGSPYLADNADAVLPMVDDEIVSQYPSSAFMEDGSFLRLKTIQLSYTLPKNISKKLTMENLQVYVQGTNLLTITKYKGLDPEINESGVNLGIDAGQWPTARQIVFGIKIDL